jgi:LmbE family N-acetylglucosaminyl deacetylase
MACRLRLQLMPNPPQVAHILQQYPTLRIQIGGHTDDLARQRTDELRAAAEVLGIRSMRLLSYPDGRLSESRIEQLSAEVEDAATAGSVDCLLVFDESGITGHPDHRRATAAALAAAADVDSDPPRFTGAHSVSAASTQRSTNPFPRATAYQPLGRGPTELIEPPQPNRQHGRQRPACAARPPISHEAKFGSVPHRCH